MKGPSKVEGFGPRLQELREQMGWKQSALAAFLGVSQPCVRNWEEGRRVPGAQGLMNICHLFGVSADWLLGLKEE